MHILAVLIKTHPVSSYVRSDGTPVSSYLKGDYCKEKWGKADYWGPRLKDNKSSRPWKRQEEELVLKLLSEMPEWLQLQINAIYRKDKSEIIGNSASANVRERTIAFYNIFFKSKDGKQIISHELSHILYQSLSPKDLLEFKDASGWTVEVKDSKIFESPPKKVIKSDSTHSYEEDFANNLEIYLKSKNQFKKFNSKTYNFLIKGFLYEIYYLINFYLELLPNPSYWVAKTSAKF